MNTTPLSCIIPAYNEASRIGEVLAVVSACSYITEIIVVDDASTDNTQEVLKQYPHITVITQTQNKGKTHAVMRGIEASKNDIILLIDADLTGLTIHDISALAEPVLLGTTDVSISIRKNSLGIYKILGIDFFSGERVLHKKILGDIHALSQLPKFGLETYMNSLIIQQQLRIMIVPWNRVSHYRKSEKMGFVQGTMKELSMISEILRTAHVYNLLSDMVHLRELRVTHTDKKAT